MSHLQIAVLRGGPSEEYAVSMLTGAAVLKALSENGHQTKDIIIAKDGSWLDRGVAKSPEIILASVDMVFIALHGTYGEDGDVQKLLHRLHVPFTGSSAFQSARAFNKGLTKKTLQASGILMPKDMEVSAEDGDVVTISNSIKDSFGPEYIIKPVSSGSSYGVQYVSAGESLAEALASALQKYERVLVEEFIMGREATCATIEDFRNQDIYVFPSVEIVTPGQFKFFNTDSKYDGSTREICPARFSYSDRIKIEEVSAIVHEAMELSQYSRSDFIVSDKGIYFLEVNTLPGLTPESLYPKAAASVGMNINQLVDHLVQTATC